MQIKVVGDGEGFDLQVRIRWLAFQGFLKAVLAIVVLVMALLSSRAGVQVLTWLGW